MKVGNLKRFREGDAVYVEWEDSVGYDNGWADFAEYRQNIRSDPGACSPIRTIAFVFDSEHDWLAVSPHFTGFGNTRDVLVIPRSAIRKIERVEGFSGRD